jgi:16S rRNA (guanine(966)-N(2))-methyltransferase RsmD
LVRGALFAIIEPYLERPLVLDLFAGTGALGIEALNHGAAGVDFVESNLRQCVALRARLRALDHETMGHVHWTRVERALGFLKGPYDLVLMDPPYVYAGTAPLLDRIASSSLVAEGGILAVEHGRRTLMPDSVGDLTVLKRRRHGDTALTIYTYGGSNETW